MPGFAASRWRESGPCSLNSGTGGTDSARGPTRLMSPSRTLKSCGTSSSRVRSSNRPTRVTRGSGSPAAGAEKRAASTRIERNLNTEKIRPNCPVRSWRTSAGPVESSRIATAIASRTGAAMRHPSREATTSMARFVTTVTRAGLKPEPRSRTLWRRLSAVISGAPRAW